MKFRDQSVEQLAEEFTPEQKEYLSSFFAQALEQVPFVGHVRGGAITADSASGVENLASATFFGTAVEDLSGEELWKYERNPLDAWDALLAHAQEGTHPDSEHRYRFKTFGLFHVAPAQDSFMLRMRVPGGALSSSQLRGLCAIATQWGNKRLDLTTRCNVQIREFAPSSIVDVLNSVRRLGMTSNGSGADNIRNITASPISGYDSTELIDVQPFADALQNYISNSRDMFGLPRKFNIAFDNGGRVSALADTNDIGFSAVRVPEGKSVPAGVYFRVLLCGITGHKQFATDCGMLLHPAQTVAVAAAMVRVFAEHGDRTNRKKARLKYLVDGWGIDRFLQETEKLLSFPVLYVPQSDCLPRREIDRAAHLGVHAQAQPGLSYVGVVVPVGFLSIEKAEALAGIAERYGNSELRLTVWQNLIIPNIPSAALGEACEALTSAGLEYTAGRVMSGTVACTGERGCRFAATDTKAHALELARSLDARFVIDQPINLHVTGCSNSCAQHYIGDIGLMGVKVAGKAGYQVNLGGGADNDQAIARELFPAMPYGDVVAALHQLLAVYAATRVAGEPFQTFARRHSVEELRSMCVEGRTV